MTVKLWIVLALIYVAESHVIRSIEEILPAEGMALDVIIKPYSQKLTFGDSSGKRISRRTHDVVVPPIVSASEHVGDKGTKEVVPELENRFGIRGGICPTGYVRRGGFCFPDDYD